MVKIDEDTVVVISEHAFFEKEKSGAKPNTTRVVNKKEHFALMRPEVTTIVVQEAGSKELKLFAREIVDKCFVGHLLGRYIVTISWKHEE